MPPEGAEATRTGPDADDVLSPAPPAAPPTASRAGAAVGAASAIASRAAGKRS